jgi:hypothetical protein
VPFDRLHHRPHPRRPHTGAEPKVRIERLGYPVLVGRSRRGPDSERLTDNDLPSITVARDNSMAPTTS